jgi:hypothetical protein
MNLPLPPVIVAAEPVLVTFAIFAHNVAVGAALCAAFDEGWDQHELWNLFHGYGHRLSGKWRPGCELPSN